MCLLLHLGHLPLFTMLGGVSCPRLEHPCGGLCTGAAAGLFTVAPRARQTNHGQSCTCPTNALLLQTAGLLNQWAPACADEQASTSLPHVQVVPCPPAGAECPCRRSQASRPIVATVWEVLSTTEAAA